LFRIFNRSGLDLKVLNGLSGFRVISITYHNSPGPIAVHPACSKTHTANKAADNIRAIVPN